MGGAGRGGGSNQSQMEIVVVVVLVLMLVGVGYAQWQRGVVRTVGPLSLGEEEIDQPSR